MSGVLAYDRARLEQLQRALGDALDELRRIHTSDPAAAGVMQGLRAACRTLAEVHLAKVHELLASDVMTWYRRSADGSSTATTTLPYSTAHDRSWEAVSAGVYPLAPRVRSMNEVLEAVRTKQLVPLDAPLDAEGRAGEIYTSIAIAPNNPRLLGTQDITPDTARFVNVVSDGLPFAFHDNQELEVWHFTDARIVSSVHRLTAYPAGGYPETLFNETEEAVVSGYLLLKVETTDLAINIPIGPPGGDPTLSWPIDLGSGTEYSGVFVPDSPPHFVPIPRQPRFVAAPKWTFTKSAGPMVDGWGTWGL